ncbi:DUF4259 domain-containing protein [Nocardioides mesophilus]|uniref:DUF4259 domain-containing protein n=1 Tax=Nocardioides mesophilus TaxID=433659 RepID=A0A7G9RAY3_9ACTN|nr:DUF4259 domain-containing protein [Nocardioides mesophilus]QNN52758.1 hypothetical protein H9L09_20375 [Nocardioides mesophilus]
MGAWGPAIFSDDTAADVRGDYRELLEDQVSDEEATRRVIAEYERLDQDEAHVLWLALAAAQHQVGRLDEDVKRRAVGVIDSEVGLELWAETGPKELAKRKAALSRLREQLTGPQPARQGAGQAPGAGVRLNGVKPSLTRARTGVRGLAWGRRENQCGGGPLLLERELRRAERALRDRLARQPEEQHRRAEHQTGRDQGHHGVAENVADLQP